jgi:transketolase
MAKNHQKIIKDLDELSIATIRSLCIDAINKSKSGHPGMCLSAAPIIYSLYKDFLNSNPQDSKWINRDRFVLSAGHGSMLLYSILHLSGYKVSMSDIMKFRQLHSITPGHPEIGVTDGVDASSGPLGQGIAQAVGMAIAETKLRALYGEDIYNHYTYCLCGDGCLEEGISQEAITFAGLNKLNKLILLYDRNNVTLDGPLAQSSEEDVIRRFEASGWNVITVYNGNNYKKVKKAIAKAKKSKDKPTLVIFKTVIGLGSKNEGTCKVHGSPLGEEDGRNAKLSYGFDYPEFTVSSEVYEHIRNAIKERVNPLYQAYNDKVQESDKY